MTYAGKKILCIEDHRETAALIAEDLSDRGYVVTQKYDGSAGLGCIPQLRPDLILCDINLPGLSGFELLEELAALAPGFCSAPFVFLTALTDREHELKGRRLGADDYVTKPVDFDILASIIQARLARTSRLDIWSRRIALSQRELEVLTWAARGKTSDEIASILDLSKRTVDFHIDNARLKLDVTSRTQAAAKAAACGLIAP